MYTLTATLIILVFLALNHLVNGFECWGLHPAGQFSQLLFSVQVLVSFGAVIWTIYWLFAGRQSHRVILAVMVIGCGVLAVWQFFTVGGRMFTSGHDQGAENLPTFAFTALIAVVVGGYKLWLRRQSRWM